MTGKVASSLDADTYRDKVVLVTGSGRGIGKEIALKFAQHGAKVIVNYFRNRAQAQKTLELIKEYGNTALIVKANIGKVSEIMSLFSEIKTEFGGLDILISNAASGYNRPIMEQKEKGWNWTMDINAKGFLFAVQQAVPLMEQRGGGHIVSISSPGARWVANRYSVVGASKAALETLTRYCAVELADKNIVVNSVAPGLVRTEALHHFEFNEEYTRNPAGRMVTPEDVAKVILFLCSPSAYMIRGQVILIDGGRSLLASGQIGANPKTDDH